MPGALQGKFSDLLPDHSRVEYVCVVGLAWDSGNPDLSAFRDHGGKILIWHELADQLIFPQGTIQYYQRVQQAMGGPASTDTFARLFLAPGAQHCASAVGPAPADPLAAVVKWVEHGQAPTSIPATVADPATGAVTLSRPLCAYPLVARYTGRGSTSQRRTSSAPSTTPASNSSWGAGKHRPSPAGGRPGRTRQAR
jgi:hypothetical protein